MVRLTTTLTSYGHFSSSAHLESCASTLEGLLVKPPASSAANDIDLDIVVLGVVKFIPGEFEKKRKPPGIDKTCVSTFCDRVNAKPGGIQCVRNVGGGWDVVMKGDSGDWYKSVKVDTIQLGNEVSTGSGYEQAVLRHFIEDNATENDAAEEHYCLSLSTPLTLSVLLEKTASSGGSWPERLVKLQRHKRSWLSTFFFDDPFLD